MKALTPALLAVAISACSTNGVAPDQPAVRTSETEASLRELQQVVKSALNGADVTLAADALTASSNLTIERTRQRSLDGNVEPGRDYGRPERFQLVIDGRQCFLVHARTGLRYLLADTRCTPESGPLEMGSGN